MASLLRDAILSDDKDRARALILRGSDPCARFGLNGTCVLFDILMDKKGPSWLLLVTDGMPPAELCVVANIARYSGFTVLMCAVEHGNTEAVDLLINWGANVEARVHRSGWTAMHAACTAGDFPIAVSLICAGAGFNARAVTGGSAKKPIQCVTGDRAKRNRFARLLSRKIAPCHRKRCIECYLTESPILSASSSSSEEEEQP